MKVRYFRVVLIGILLVCALQLFLIGYTGWYRIKMIQEQEQEVEKFRKAVYRIYEKSLSVRISLDIGMPLVAQEKWYEDLQPAIEEALELCKEVSE